MKLKSLTLILLSLFIFGATACNTDSEKKPSKKKPTTSKKIMAANDYWASAKKTLGLTSAQVNGIKSINKKYGNQINNLRKAKKWDGKANTKTRKTLQTKKTAELKKLLGNKLPLYNKFTTKNGIKKAKKKNKGPKKKGVKKGVKKNTKPSKKKPVKKGTKKQAAKKKKSKK